ncbi:hypothetical protein HDV03_001337 [Kappamyces sp. JEL0829]|nr:hypothetical protein HDV03_001337 [Kappamyces sp. JEL0829]
MTHTVGILALQGAFAEHVHVLERLQVKTVLVKTQKDLDSIQALILPGGESTAISLAAARNDLIEPLKKFIASGKPVWGTCAGMILLAKEALGAKKGGQELFGGLDITVQRNAFGGQVDSFVAPLHIQAIPDAEKDFQGVFIRAPIISRVGEGVKVLCTINDKIVAVQQAKIFATAFHPELTADDRVHRYFLSLL